MCYHKTVKVKAAQNIGGGAIIGNLKNHRNRVRMGEKFSLFRQSYSFLDFSQSLLYIDAIVNNTHINIPKLTSIKYKI